MSTNTTQLAGPERIRQRLLIMSCLALFFAVLGHLSFSLHWPHVFRIFEFAALMSAPAYLSLGVLELVRYQRSWQVFCSVVVSAIACLVVYLTMARLIHGLYWA
jgi:hypothetical protein